MSNDNLLNVEEAPLRRFIQLRKNNNGHAATTLRATTPECRELRNRKDVANEQYDSSKRRTSRTEWFSAASEHGDSKPRLSRRPRKSTSSFTNAKKHAHITFTIVDGYCRCGAEAEAPYFDRCEDCFAEDSERWCKNPQRADIRW